jgi:hypothetical protein
MNATEARNLANNEIENYINKEYEARLKQIINHIAFYAKKGNFVFTYESPVANTYEPYLLRKIRKELCEKNGYAVVIINTGGYFNSIKLQISWD